MTETTRLDTLKGWLLEAELAHHKLATGSKEVEIETTTPNGERQKVGYNLSSAAKLKVYITDLKAEIAAIQNGGTASAYRAVGYSSL